MRRLLLIAMLTAAAILTVEAQGTRTRVDVSKLGPQAGQRAPDFRLFDQAGKEQTLQSITGPRGAMLVFIRSADW